MTFTVEHMKSLLRALVTALKKVKINITSKIKQFLSFSQSKLYEHLTVLKTFCRNLLVGQDIPNVFLFTLFIYSLPKFDLNNKKCTTC